MKRRFASCVSTVTLLAFAHTSLFAQLSTVTPPSPAAQQPATQFKPEELEQLVAPIALYPDALLAQMLMAATYPLEVVMASLWAKSNAQLKGDALTREAEKQSWDPTVKALVAFPTVLAMMSEKIDWTQKLGDAFLAQQKEVMHAVQRLRRRAQQAGNLKDSNELAVKTEPAPAGAPVTQTIVIESKDPDVVYVPTYDPFHMYGDWLYPAYPPYYYYPPGYVAGAALFTFTAGMVVGGILSGGFNWNNGNVDINVNRNANFNRNNINNINRDRGGNNWQHNPEHRRGTQYRDSASQQKFGRGSNPQATQAREQFRGRAEQGREQISREGVANQRDLAGREIGARDGAQSRDFGGTPNRERGGGTPNHEPGSGNRDLGGAQSRDLGGANRDFGSSNPRGGNRDFGGAQSRDLGGSRSSAFGGGSGSSARMNSSRGGMSRGGGFGGGGGRGGGGRR